MITLKKLASLPVRIRLRKCGFILRQSAAHLHGGLPIEREYLRQAAALAAAAAEEPGFQASPSPSAAAESSAAAVSSAAAGQLAGKSAALAEALRSGDNTAAAWLCDDLYYGIMETLGVTAADWDFGFGQEPDARTAAKARIIYPVRPYLDHIRSPWNVGALFRSAESFCCDRVLLSPETPSPEHPRAMRTSRGTAALLPWEYGDLDLLELCGPVFALESGGTPLDSFPFPPSGTVIVGSEELGVSPAALALADGSLGRVTIPTYGTKGSLNLAVAFGILMQRWAAVLTAAGRSGSR